MKLRDLPTAALVDRRARLGERLGDRVGLVPAGAPSARNYAANTYPYRAGSHFLYLAGWPLEGAYLRWAKGEWAVFAPERAADDALWHGPGPSFDEVADAVGCRIRPLSELRPFGAHRVATVPAIDRATRARQAELLGRSPTPPTEDDLVLHDALIALRLVHDEAARAGLRAAAEATTAAHRAGMAVTRPGILEAEVRAAMEAECLKRGLGLAYPPIVTVHGEILHHRGHDGRLEHGDLLLADVGAESAGGWAGDVTRTWPVAGAFSATQRDVYQVVLHAQERAIAAARPGVRYRDVHLTAARALTEGLVELGVLRGDVDELVADGVHALLFPHGVGHLLGLDVHDMEDLGDRAGYAPGRQRSDQFGLSYLRLDRDLAPGMAVTIEPGLYQVPGILADADLTKIAKDRLDRSALARFADVRGIRIEDDVLVTEDGPEVLTAAIPKAIDAVEAAVGGPRG
ncbi:MAG: aminopeptidase P family protein [Sandaracinaceae bacterium]